MKLVFCLIVIVGLIQGCGSYRLVCVYTNWSQYRPEGGKFLPEDIDPMLCTHIIYVYAKLKSNKLEPAEWNDESTVWNEGMYEKVTSLKHVNVDLKVLLGVGGWMMGSKDFSRMAASAGSRRLFAKTTVKYLRDRKFDGLSIDWQHPTKRGGHLKDKANFPLLLKEVRKEFEEESKDSGLTSLMLVISVAASKEIIDDAYEIDNLTRYTDFINVFAYDLHGPWDNYTGHPSQLYPRKQEFGPSAEINVDATMRYWISQVQNRSHLNLGVSTYTRTYTLRKVRHNDFNVPTTGPGVAGEFTQQPGMLAYYERCTTYADAKRVWDPASQVAYWYSGDQWIAGEDIESLKSKVNWLRRIDIGGITFLSLDMDDFRGTFCMGDKYPLLNTVHEQLVAPISPVMDWQSHINRQINLEKVTEQAFTATDDFLTDIYETTTEPFTEFNTPSTTTPSTTNKQSTTLKAVTASRTAGYISPRAIVVTNKPIKVYIRNDTLTGFDYHKKQTNETTESTIKKYSTDGNRIPDNVNVNHKESLNVSQSVQQIEQILRHAGNLSTHRLINGIMRLLEFDRNPQVMGKYNYKSSNKVNKYDKGSGGGLTTTLTNTMSMRQDQNDVTKSIITPTFPTKYEMRTGKSDLYNNQKISVNVGDTSKQSKANVLQPPPFRLPSNGKTNSKVSFVDLNELGFQLQ